MFTLSPVDNNAPAALPAQGCITAKPNYGRGNNGGDDKSCAVLRWGSSDGLASGTTDLFNQIFGNDPNAPSTMVSMSGTVYTPSAAVDIAEYGRYCQQTRKNRFLWWVWDACDGTNANAFSGVNYPVVDRGIIARTVRIRGLKVDPEYTDYVVGCGRDDCGNTTVPNAKLVTLEAKIDATDGASPPKSASVRSRRSASTGTRPLHRAKRRSARRRATAPATEPAIPSSQALSATSARKRSHTHSTPSRAKNRTETDHEHHRHHPDRPVPRRAVGQRRDRPADHRREPAAGSASTAISSRSTTRRATATPTRRR